MLKLRTNLTTSLHLFAGTKKRTYVVIFLLWNTVASLGDLWQY